MDCSLKDARLTLCAHHLLSLSSTLEPFIPNTLQNPLNVLAFLEELAITTQLNLTAQWNNPAPQKPIQLHPPLLSTIQPASQRSEYQPALKDQSLIQALLKLKSQTILKAEHL